MAFTKNDQSMALEMALVYLLNRDPDWTFPVPGLTAPWAQLIEAKLVDAREFIARSQAT